MLQEYRAGRLLTGELKGKCIALLQKFVKEFQEVTISEILIDADKEANMNFPVQRKAKVTDEEVRSFMDPTRKITPKFGKRAQV